MLELLRCLEVECQAVRAAAGSGGKGRGSGILWWESAAVAATEAQVEAADMLLSEAKRLQDVLGEDPSNMSSCLRVLHDEASPEGFKFPL